MISLSGFLCLALSIGAVVCFDEDVDCKNCTFYNGLGYVKSQEYAVAYYVCIPFGDGYRVETQCCETGMTFDQEHLTCIVDSELDKDLSEAWCPNSTFSDRVCPFYGEDGEEDFYSIYTYEEYQCAPGTWWNQENCTCVHGIYVPPCPKIMHFDFTDGYDSESCNYIIDGTPHYYTDLVDGALSLDGMGFVAVAFLYNWPAWNPIANEFTFCVRVNPRSAASNGCIFSTNCNVAPGHGSLLELGLVNGVLAAYLGSAESTDLGAELPVGEFSQICVTYVNGKYTVCVNEDVVYEDDTDTMPINSQTESFIGMNPQYGYFDGLIDDVCFWIEARSKEQIAADHD